MANLFDIETGELCDEDIVLITDELSYPVESLRSLILEFCYKQVFTLYSVCCDLAAAGVHSICC